MEKHQTQPVSKQDEDYDAELKEALSHPGILDVLELHTACYRYMRDLYSDRKVNEEHTN